MKERDNIDILLSALDDYRAVIAAGKIQRWEVLKWAVAINIGLAAAAAALPNARLASLILSCLVAFAGLLLIWFYNRRMTGAREISGRLEGQIAKIGIDFRAIEDDPRRARDKSVLYDLEELVIFALIILASVAPLFVIYNEWISVPTCA
jgi:hypothetical protein